MSLLWTTETVVLNPLVWVFTMKMNSLQGQKSGCKITGWTWRYHVGVSRRIAVVNAGIHMSIVSVDKHIFKMSWTFSYFFPPPFFCRVSISCKLYYIYICVCVCVCVNVNEQMLPGMLAQQKTVAARVVQADDRLVNFSLHCVQTGWSGSPSALFDFLLWDVPHCKNSCLSKALLWPLEWHLLWRKRCLQWRGFFMDFNGLDCILELVDLQWMGYAWWFYNCNLILNATWNLRILGQQRCTVWPRLHGMPVWA